MLRFICKHQLKDGSGCQFEHFYTLLLSVPELEELLKRGGRGEDSYDMTTLSGVELVEDEVK